MQIEQSLISGKLAGYSQSSISSLSNSTFSCASPQASLYELDGNGDRREPAISITSVADDGTYSFDLDKVGKTKAYQAASAFAVPLVVVISGCSSGVYFRPLTGYKNQDVSAGSSLVGYLLNTSRKGKLADALMQSSSGLDSLLAIISSANNVNEAYSMLSADATARGKFNDLFGTTPDILNIAFPEVISLEMPTKAQEMAALSLRVSAAHWSAAYNSVYLWKLDGVVIGRAADSTFTPNGNSQGHHSLVLTFGENDGAGDVDLSKPYKVVTQDLEISNNVLPSAPIFSVTSPLVSGVTPINTRNITVTLNTGSQLVNCGSFSSLLLTEDIQAPHASASFPISCTQAGGQDVSFNLSSSGDGLKTLYLWAKDSADVVSLVPTSFSFYIDTAPPTVGILTTPLALSNISSQSFVFSGSDNGGIIDHFECLMDSGAWTSCSSPMSYSSLAQGDHTFSVKAIDTAGNVSLLDTKNWHIDLTAPVLTLQGVPAVITNELTATFSFSATDSGGAGVAGYQCNLDGSGWSSCVSPKVNLLTAGVHNIAIRASDNAGNISSVQNYSWTIDTTPPVTTISAKPASLTNSQMAVFAFSASDTGGGAVAGYQCQFDGGAFAACTSPSTYSSLLSGSHTFSVKATDTAGNLGNAVAYNWTIDTTTPLVSINSGPNNITNSSSATFTFSANPPPAGSIQGYECKIDAGSWISCSSPKTYASLTEATHVFQVRSIDNNSNYSTPSSESWVVDLTAPTLSISSKPNTVTAEQSASFVFNATDLGGGTVAFYSCKMDGASYSDCSSPMSYSSISEGSHTFSVTATDTAGNVSAVSSFTWLADYTAPTVTISSNPNLITNITNASFSFSGVDAGSGSIAGYKCSLDGGSSAVCVSSKNYSGLAAGSHSFSVIAIDMAGNESTSANYTWTIDLTPPVLTLTSTPNSITNATTASFSFSATDTGGGSVASYQCKIDSGSYLACSSPSVYSSLAQGVHTFAVTALDTAGNISNVGSYSWTVDTTPPIVTISTPAANGSVAVTSNISSFAVAGTCSENGLPVLLSGASTNSVICSSGAWSTNINLSSLSDGVLSLTATQTDAAGNTASSVARTFIKDTVAPVINITTPTILQGNSSTGVVSWSLTEPNVTTGTSFSVEIYNGSAWSNVSTKAVIAGANTNQAYTLSNFAVPNVDITTAKIRVSFTDAAGNVGQATSGTFLIDSTAPSISSISINNGATSTTSNYVSVNLQLQDNRAANAFCLKYNTTTTPLTTDPCWTLVTSPAAGSQAPGAVVSIANYGFTLGFGSGTFKVYAWAKDQAGNISTLSNSGNGTSGLDYGSITYSPGTPPIVSSLIAAAVDLPDAPPSLAQLAVPTGADLYVRWRVTAGNGMPGSPISIYYYDITTSTWLPIPGAQNLVNGANGTCTVDDPNTALVETGCLRLSGGSPTSNPYQVQIRITDNSGMTSLASSIILNTGSVRVLAGNTDPGVGGAAQSAVFFSNSGGDYTYMGHFVVTPMGMIFYFDSRGLFRITPDKGTMDLYIKSTGTVSGVGGPVASATMNNLNKIIIDHQGNVIFSTNSGIFQFNPNATIPVLQQLKSGSYSAIASLPNGKMYITQNDGTYGVGMIYLFDPVANTTVALPLSGTSNSMNTMADITACSLSTWGLSYDLNTSALTFLQASSSSGGACGTQSTPSVPWTVFDPTTFVSLSTLASSPSSYPANHPYPTWAQTKPPYVGLDGNLYLAQYADGKIYKLDKAQNKFVIAAGVSFGYCQDGTAASSCMMSPQDMFVDEKGKIYVQDGGRIRIIRDDGTLLTLYGAWLGDGDGGSALAARLYETNYLALSDSNKIMFFQNSHNIIREFTPGGTISRILGNANAGFPSPGGNSTQPLPGVLGWNARSKFFYDQANREVYMTGQTSIDKFNRNTGVWSRVLLSNTSGTNYVNADGMPASAIRFYTQNMLPIGLYNNKLHIMTFTQNVPYPNVTLIKAYDPADSYRQSSVGGIYNNTGTPVCTTGSIFTSCFITGAMGNLDSPGITYDPTGNAFYVPYNSTTSDKLLKWDAGGNVTIYNTAQAPSTAAYRRIAGSPDTELVYYCGADKKLHRYNLTTVADTTLSTPSMIGCAGRNMIYDSANNRLLFSFVQNGLWGIAEFVSPP